MPRAVITQEIYDRLLAAYREVPGNKARACRIAGCGPMMGGRAWDYGWPDKPWAPPIKGVLLREQEEARAAVFREQDRARQVQDEMRETARQEAIEARTQEGHLVQAARKNALSVLVSINQLNKGVLVLCQELSKMLENRPNIDPLKAVMLVERTVRASRQAGEQGHRAIVMERLVLGQPTDIVKLTGDADEAFSVDDALEDIRRAKEAAENYVQTHRHGELRVIEGGRPAEKPPLPPLPPPPPGKTGTGGG